MLRSALVAVGVVLAVSAVQAQDLWRPSFHFAPESGWMNDPCGLVYVDGWFVLFYQRVPGQTTFDPAQVEWGRARSQNLVDWEELDRPALAPGPAPGDPIGASWAPFTGSAVLLPPAETQALCNCGPGRRCVAAFYTRSSEYFLQRQDLGTSCNPTGPFIPPFRRILDNPDPSYPHFRDPKVFRFVDDQGAARWIMLVAAGHRILFYSSTDLVDWTPLSELTLFDLENDVERLVGPFLETPDLFPLPVEGGAGPLWVLVFAEGYLPPGTCGSYLPADPTLIDSCETLLARTYRTRYLVGVFDGQSFLVEGIVEPGTELISASRPFDAGPDFYAPQSWSNAPPKPIAVDRSAVTGWIGFPAPNLIRSLSLSLASRRIVAGWMSNWLYAHALPTSPSRGVLSVPRELSLVSDGGTHVLRQRPVAEIESRRQPQGRITLAPRPIQGAVEVPGVTVRAYDLEVTLTIGTATDVGVELQATPSSRGVRVGWRRPLATGPGFLYLDRRGSAGPGVVLPGRFETETALPVSLDDGTLDLRVLVDRGSVEVFAEDGRHVLTALTFPSAFARTVRVVARGGTATLDRLELHPLERVPSGPSSVTIEPPGGGSCSSDADCGSGTCTAFRTFPGGEAVVGRCGPEPDRSDASMLPAGVACRCVAGGS